MKRTEKEYEDREKMMDFIESNIGILNFDWSSMETESLELLCYFIRTNIVG